MRNVKLASFEAGGQIFGPGLYIGKAELAEIAWFDAVDDVVTEGAAELVFALFTDGVEFDGLARSLQLFRFFAGEANDVGVECASQTLVRCGNDEQMDVVLAGSGQQFGRLRADGDLRRDAGHHGFEAFCIGTRRLGCLGCPTQFCRSDHLHRLGDLLGRFDRVDPDFKGLKARHSGFRLCEVFRELIECSNQRLLAVVAEVAAIANALQNVGMVGAKIGQHRFFVTGNV